MAILASDWMRHFRILVWNRWTEFNETIQEARSQHPLQSLWVYGFGPIGNTRWPPWPQWNLTGSKISTSSTKFVFFGPIGKTRLPALISVWLRHFRLLLWNLWTEFNETGQEAGSQHPLLSLCFWGRTEKQDDRPCLWLAETFPTSLKPLNGIQRYLTGSRISISSTKFVFFRQNCSPCRSVKKVTHCTQVHDMWRFGPRVYYMSMLGRKLFPFFQTEPVQVPNNCILVFIVKSQPWFRSRTLYIVVSIFVDRLFRVPIFLLCIGLSIMSLYRRAMITISCYRGPLFLIHTANPTLVQILIFEKLPNPQVFSYFWIAYCIMFCLCFFSFFFSHLFLMYCFTNVDVSRLFSVAIHVDVTTSWTYLKDIHV